MNTPSRYLPSILILFVVIAAFRLLCREVLHDEGVTFEQAVNHVECDPAKPLPVATIYRQLDSSPRHGMSETVRTLKFHGMHPPAYYLFVNQLARLAGTGWTLRLSGLLFGVFAIAGLSRLAQMVIGKPVAGCWAALLGAVSCWHVDVATYLRPYGLALCLGVWSTCIAYRLAAAPAARFDRLAWVMFTLLSLLGIYTIYHYAFLIVWQFLWITAVFWKHKDVSFRSRLPWLTAFSLCLLAGYVAWLPNFVNHMKVTDRYYYFSGVISPAEFPERLLEVLSVFAFGRPPDHPTLALLAFEAILVTSVLFVLAVCRIGGCAESRPAFLFWTSMPVLPGLILAADVIKGTHTLFVDKTVFMLFPVLVLAVVFAFLKLKSRALANSGLVLWTAAAAAATTVHCVREYERVSDYEKVVGYLAANDKSSHVVLFSSAARGYTQPFLRLLRQSSTQDLRMTLGKTQSLSAVVLRLMDDHPDTDRITLINVGAIYSAELQRWSEFEIQAATRQVERSRWSIHRYDTKYRLANIPCSESPQQTLTLIDGAKVRFLR